MRHIKLLLSAILLLVVGLTYAQAQTMYVKESTGTQTAYALDNIRKMTFTTGNLIITKTDNSNSIFELNELRYLNFTDLSTSIEEPLYIQNQLLRIYPNPANNLLNIDLTRTEQSEGTLNIINIEGKVVISKQITKVGVLALDISNLPNGIYLCHYKNATESETIKIIKQ